MIIVYQRISYSSPSSPAHTLSLSDLGSPGTSDPGLTDLNSSSTYLLISLCFSVVVSPPLINWLICSSCCSLSKNHNSLAHFTVSYRATPNIWYADSDFISLLRVRSFTFHSDSFSSLSNKSILLLR